MAPRIIAHRGATHAAPGNTIAAFEDARTAGADGVEFDVQWTADQKVVVIHGLDAQECCAEGGGLVAGLTREHLQSLDLIPGDSGDRRPHRVPDLRSVLRLDGLAFEIELKRADIEFVEQVLSEVDDAGAVQGAEFTSSFLGALVHLRRSAPSATLGYFARRPPEGTHLGAYRPLLVEDCLALQLDVLHAPLDLLDEALVDLCHLSGLRVHAANVDEPADLLAAAELGVDQLSTNRCDLAVQVLNG